MLFFSRSKEESRAVQCAIVLTVLLTAWTFRFLMKCANETVTIELKNGTFLRPFMPDGLEEVVSLPASYFMLPARQAFAKTQIQTRHYNTQKIIIPKKKWKRERNNKSHSAIPPFLPFFTLTHLTWFGKFQAQSSTAQSPPSPRR